MEKERISTPRLEPRYDIIEHARYGTIDNKVKLGFSSIVNVTHPLWMGEVGG